MSKRNVRQNGDEILRKKSKDVAELTPHLRDLIADMKDTMKELGGCGLAAVQVGVLKKIILCAPDEEKEPIVLVNPEITKFSDETEVDFEGCLSVDGFRGKVERSTKITVKAKDEDMKDISFEAEGFYARIIMHEVDHLNGVMYIDKVIDGTLEDLNKDEKDD